MADTNYYCAAVVAARKILKQYKQLNNNNLSYPLKLTTVREHGWAEKSEQRGLVAAASNISGKPITAAEFASRSDQAMVIAAMLVAYEDRSRILVSDANNFCYKRFLVAKELCHVIMGKDNAETHTSTPEQVISLLSGLVNVSAPDSNPAISADIAAYYGAIELLMPEEFQTTADEMLKSGKTHLDIAYKLMAPEAIVEFRYSRGEIRQFFDNVYNSHEYKTCDIPHN